MPSSKPDRISLCMIVRDEEEFLDACLDSVAGVADEIVGPRHRLYGPHRRYRSSHGARVHSHPWKDSYSEARTPPSRLRRAIGC